MIHLDNGREVEEVCLDKPYEGLYIANNVGSFEQMESEKK